MERLGVLYLDRVVGLDDSKRGSGLAPTWLLSTGF
jgi:hypothetical protein